MLVGTLAMPLGISYRLRRHPVAILLMLSMFACWSSERLQETTADELNRGRDGPIHCRGFRIYL